MMNVSEFIEIFTQLLIVLSPIACLPAYTALTKGILIESERMHILNLAILVMFIVMLMALLFGPSLLSFLGITISSFRIAGGSLLFYIGFLMMSGKAESSEDKAEKEVGHVDRKTMAVVPIAIPLLSGPATISTVLFFSTNSELLSFDTILLILAICCVSAVAWITLYSANYISAYLGRTGMACVNRIVGLILSAIAVEHISLGIKNLFF